MIESIYKEQQIVLFCSGMEMEQKDIDWNEVVAIAHHRNDLSFEEWIIYPGKRIIPLNKGKTQALPVKEAVNFLLSLSRDI